MDDTRANTSARVEKLSIGEIDEILVKMEADLAAEESETARHEWNDEPDAKEQSVWNCVVYRGYIDVLKKARARLVVKNGFDSIWAEKDDGKQLVQACKLITTIAREGSETTYLCLLGPLLRPPLPPKELSKKEKSFVQKELAALASMTTITS